MPYPNIATSQMAVGAVYNVLFVGAPAHNLSTSIPLTNGDNLGVGRGVVSGSVMGNARHTSGATTVLIGGAPATRLTSTSIQNGTNAPGMRIAPSQLKVLILAP